MAGFTRFGTAVDTAAQSTTRTLTGLPAPTEDQWYIVRFCSRGGGTGTGLTVTSSTGGWDPDNGAVWGTPVVEFLSGGGNRFIMSVPVQAGSGGSGDIVATFDQSQGDTVCLVAVADDLTGTRVQWDPHQGTVDTLTPELGVAITAGNDALAAVAHASDVDFTWASGYTSLGARVEGSVNYINAEDADVDSTDRSATVSWSGSTRAVAIVEEWEIDAGGGSVESGDLSSAGAATVAFVGAAIAAAVFASAGAATPSFVGAATAEAVLASSGAATVSWVGASTAESIFASAGAASVAFTGASTAAGVLSSSGVGSAAFSGASTAAGVLNAAGAASVAWSNATTGEGALSSAGVAAASFVGASIAAGVLAAAGEGALSGVGAAIVGAVFTAAGQGTALWVPAGTVSGVFSAAGQAVVSWSVSQPPDLSPPYTALWVDPVRAALFRDPARTAGWRT